MPTPGRTVMRKTTSEAPISHLGVAGGDGVRTRVRSVRPTQLFVHRLAGPGPPPHIW